MRDFACFLGMLLIVPGVLSVPATPDQDPNAIEDLRARIKQRAALPNVDQRECVDDFFTLADACAKEGKNDEAVSLYEQGLRVDPWRLECQLQLARLLQQANRPEEAVRKAKTVYEYAEREEQTAAAGELLKELNALPASGGEPGQPSQIVADMEIVIVPIGPVNTRLLSELKEALQRKLGIRFSIARYSLVPGPADRNEADQALAKMIEEIKADMPERLYDQILTETGITEESLSGCGAKVRFVEAILRKSGYPQSQIEEFRAAIARKFRETGQHDVERLLTTLRRTHRIVPRTRIVGYLGVTEADIFTKDYNFLYGWGGREHAVMSYHRYTAAFNETPPNRPRLLERSIKQGISSTFFILDIPRCTSPACARAYPHTLIEHDQKTCDLCEECRQALTRITAKNRAVVRK